MYVSGGGKARRLQYATNERDKLHGCIDLFVSTRLKNNTLPCLPGMKR
jgi:hypothetical protein